MTVCIRIQHCPGRESINRLLEQLLPEVEVVADVAEHHDPWRGYRKCLTDLPAEGHVCVLQDDVLVSRNFAAALEQIADSNPDIPVSLFLSTAPRRTYNLASLKYGKVRYVDSHSQDLIHVVGLLWPVAKAREFLAWIDENPRSLPNPTAAYQSDDGLVTRWARLTNQRVRVTVPSLVEHPDDVPSVVNGNKAKGGKDKARTAAYWIGDDDPLVLDWSR